MGTLASARVVAETEAGGEVPLWVHPEWAERFPWLAQGTTAMTMGVDEFGRYMNDDIAKWARIVKFSGAKAE